MDGLVFDMSSQSEGVPSVFTKKDWLSILDNQNSNYQGNQCVIDTSQLANSNKFMNYREAYLTVPMLITLTGINKTSPIAGGAGNLLAINAFAPATAATSCDYAIGLKNWYGSIVHSFTLDYNGTTIIQQTPYVGMWNTFRLMTSLSYNDLLNQGSAIGFYPDLATAVGVSSDFAVLGLAVQSSYSCQSLAAGAGIGSCYNNQNCPALQVITGAFNGMSESNSGLLQRQMAWNFDPDGVSGQNLLSKTYGVLTGGATFQVGANNIPAGLQATYKSFIFNKVNQTVVPAPQINAPPATQGVWQAVVMGQVYLKHLHPFFESVPLLKGVFMKMTLNLNQSSVAFSTDSIVGAGNALTLTSFTAGSLSVQSPLGGVSPLMVAAIGTAPAAAFPQLGGSTALTMGNYIVSIAVGRTCLNTTQTNLGAIVKSSPFIGSVTLNCPAYSFNPVFESSYLSTPVKKIVYSDVYQYQVQNVASQSPFNNLVTNGIANIKSVLVLPFYNAVANGGIQPFLSPFDPAGGGPTSPFCLMTQFNIQISGQNAIYNTERYGYEQFMNQFKGVNAVNGGQTDGLTSGLVGQLDFESEYCYYYVNCGRMLPVEEAVPKSVNILGVNASGLAIDMYVFVEYGVEVSIDILTGARV